MRSFIGYSIFIAIMQAHLYHTRSVQQDAVYLHLHTLWRRGGKVTCSGTPISQTQQPVTGIESRPHDPETSTDPLR